jgi:hypothetical protein
VGSLFRTPDGTYNILSAGPTREECMAVLYKLLPGAAPGESLRCLPKTVNPRESMDPRGPKGKWAPPLRRPDALDFHDALALGG